MLGVECNCFASARHTPDVNRQGRIIPAYWKYIVPTTNKTRPTAIKSPVAALVQHSAKSMVRSCGNGKLVDNASLISCPRFVPPCRGRFEFADAVGSFPFTLVDIGDPPKL
jgi:hypothetical protein